MSETKRRSKKAEPGAPERAWEPRQTRVTLAKDVSSKYRKFMPRAGSGSAEDGGAPPKRRGPAAPRPARAPRGFAESSGSGRPPRPPRSSSGSDRSSRPPRSSSGPGRAFPARPPRDNMDPTAFRAIVHRELPEAAKQVKETRDLILTAAEDLLGLAEQLSAVHDSLGEKLSQLDNSALADDLEAARAAITGLFEKMSFQDLAGQRLLKVDGFFKSLDEALKKPPRSFSADRKGAPRPGGGERRPRFSRSEEGDRKPRAPRAERPERASRLKGPQAAGEGLAQNDIDKFLADL